MEVVIAVEVCQKSNTKPFVLRKGNILKTNRNCCQDGQPRLDDHCNFIHRSVCVRIECLHLFVLFATQTIPQFGIEFYTGTTGSEGTRTRSC